MLVKPSDSVQKTIDSILDNPKSSPASAEQSAEVLADKEAVSLFYGKPKHEEVTVWVAVTVAKVAVAVGAVVVATVKTAGRAYSSTKPLDRVDSKTTGCIDQLLQVRKEALDSN